ncbi:SDR family oxidoreductase [Glaciihabitans arcticus]|uniref:SDR family oxidoreductase n=1 Tax=Glaciihabitans arcticus TaxID=2668039 RepID=UPI001386D7ED|nr:sugar nucleotide-binding protein [Glaciihabitans arcticus]
MTRWLVTGTTGLLGSNAAISLAEANDVTGVSRTAPMGAPVPFVETDISSAAGRSGLVDRAEADVVLHAAAIASIEEAEQKPELAWRLNVEASADLAAQAAENGSRFVYISTDAVFDGENGPYDEGSEPSPTNEYGRTKLAGERAVLEANPEALVARVNFYGWSPSGTRSLAEFFHTRLALGETVRGFTDTVVSTLYVGHLVDAIAALVAAGASGVTHVVSSEATSKFDFGRRIAAGFGFDPQLVQPALSTDVLAVKRGSDISLSTGRASGMLGAPLAGQQAGIDRLVTEFTSGRPAAVRQFAPQKAV